MNITAILCDESDHLQNVSTSLTLSLNNINPELFTPITVIRVTSSDYKKLVGDYSISELAFVFNTADSKTFSESISLVALKKLQER